MELLTTLETGTPTRTPAAAFTLLELVLVLALIALILGAVAPSMRGFVASRGTADVADELLVLTKYARTQAIAAGRPCRLHVDSNAGTFWLAIQEGGTFVEPRSDLGRKITAAEGVTITLRRSTDAPRGEAAPYVEFQPSGRCEAVTIEVRGRGGDLYLVTCPSATEPFHVVTPAEGVP